MKTKHLTLFVALMSLFLAKAADYPLSVEPVAYWNFTYAPSDLNQYFTSDIGNIQTRFTSITHTGDKTTGDQYSIEDNGKFGKGFTSPTSLSARMLTSTDPLGSSKDATISFWVNFQTLAGYVGLITPEKETDANWGVCRNTNRLDFRTNGAGNYIENLGLETGKWYHIVSTWEYDGTNTNCKFYFNNQVVGSSTVSKASYVNSKKIIGDDRNYKNDRSSGAKFDEVLFFDVALNAAQIDSLYNLGVANEEFYNPYTLEALALSNPRAGAAHYDNPRANYLGPVTHDRQKLESLINDPFTYNPNNIVPSDVINQNLDNGDYLTNAYFCRSAADIYQYPNYYDGIDFLDLGFADSSFYDAGWASVDFTIPRGKILNNFDFWARNYSDQFQYYDSLGIMLEDFETQSRHGSTEHVVGTDNLFNFCDVNGTDGVKYFDRVTFTDDFAEADYTSGQVNVYMADDFLYKADRCIIHSTNAQKVGIIILEIRMAVDDAPAWEIDSLSAAVVATDTTIVKNAIFDLEALKAMYAAKVQFKDVWGYDTTGVVTWNDGGFDISVEDTYTITGTIGLPTGTVDANSTVGALNDITFQVTVDDGGATALKNAVKKSITLYPNPAQDICVIKGIESASRVRVYSLTGAEVLSAMVDANNASLNVSQLESGLYIVNVAGQTMKLQVK